MVNFMCQLDRAKERSGGCSHLRSGWVCEGASWKRSAASGLSDRVRQWLSPLWVKNHPARTWRERYVKEERSHPLPVWLLSWDIDLLLPLELLVLRPSDSDWSWCHCLVNQTCWPSRVPSLQRGEGWGLLNRYNHVNHYLVIINLFIIFLENPNKMEVSCKTITF